MIDFILTGGLELISVQSRLGSRFDLDLYNGLGFSFCHFLLLNLLEYLLEFLAFLLVIELIQKLLELLDLSRLSLLLLLFVALHCDALVF